MALSFNNLTSGKINSNGATTAVITAGANRLVIAYILTHGVLSPGTAIGNGGGLTWVQVGGPSDFGSSTNTGWWRAMGASPSATGYSITTNAGVDWIMWSIFEFDGVDTSGMNGSGAIVQSNSTFAGGSPTSLIVTLGAFGDPANGTVILCGMREDATMDVPGAGSLTRIMRDTTGAGFGGIITAYQLSNNTAPEVDVTGGDPNQLLGYAFEVKSASVTPSTSFLAAWGTQSPQLERGRPVMVASGSAPGTRII